MNNPSAGASSKTGLGTRPSTGVSHTKSASIAGTVTKNPTEQNGTGVKKVTKDMPSTVLTTTNKLTESNVSNMRDRFISLELNNLKSYGYFYGIYCVPRHFKPHIWDGVIIIRSGLYKNGKFKFYMEFPRGFPKNKPEIYFVTKVYHPLIDTETGHLDLNLLSPDWKGNSTISYNLFAWLKSIFHDTTYLQVTDSYNPKAGAEFLENIEAFYEKVCECIDHSEKELFEHEEQDGLKFNPYNAVHEVIQKKLGEVVSNKDIPDSRRVDYFIDALLKAAKTEQ